MANKDRPRGLWPIRHLSGGEIRVSEYTVSAGATVFNGDLVKIVAAGTVESAATGTGTAVIGVAAQYATAGEKILIYDDPNIVFGIQGDGSNSAVDVGATADHVSTAGNSTTLQSNHELDSSNVGTGAQLKIVGLVEDVNNSWGTNNDLEVIINEHHYKAAVAGV